MIVILIVIVIVKDYQNFDLEVVVMSRLRPRTLKRIAVVMLVLGLIIGALPYAIPLSRATGPDTPYADGYFLSYEDSWIHYRVFETSKSGASEKRSISSIRGKVLMVHGFGGSSYSFETNARTLAEAGYYVVLVDLPGFGYSSRNPLENHAQTYRAKVLWSLLDTLDQQMTSAANGMVRPWSLVGHSMGGGTVAAMGLQAPSRIDSLVLVDGALLDGNRRSSGLLQVPFLERWLQLALEHVLIRPGRIEKLLESAYGQPPTAAQIQGYLEPLSLPGTARASGALLKTSESLAPEQLEDIEVPVLAIWGEKDQWVPLEQAYQLQALFPHFSLEVITGAGHCPMETHPESYNAILLRWLQTYDN